MRRSILIAAVIAVALAGVPATHVLAAAGDGAEAARQAAQMTGGRVLDVRTSSQGGRIVYEVKVLLDDGRVRVVRIDGTPPGGGR
ncbi:MAG: hypothetical protein RKL32_19090 [Gammaproteobacteria bacterium]